MKKIFLFVIILSFIKCNQSNVKKEKKLENHTFFATKETDSGLIIYNTCWAKHAIIRFYSDKFYFDPGQEPYYYDIVDVKNTEKSISIKAKISTSKDGLIEKFNIDFLDSINQYIYFNKIKFIDSIYAYTLPRVKQPCIECYEKELCDEWARQEKEEKEKPKYIAQWQGSYSFGFGRGDTDYTMAFEIDNQGEAKVEDYEGKKTKATIVRALKDTLELKGIENRQYILYKEAGEPGYAIKGAAVYLLNPPNNDYPLVKSKR